MLKIILSTISIRNRNEKIEKFPRLEFYFLHHLCVIACIPLDKGI